MTEVSAVSFLENIGELLSRVQEGTDSIVVNENGKPVAALVDAELFHRLRNFQSRFEVATKRIADAYEGVPEPEGMQEIGDHIAQSRRG